MKDFATQKDCRSDYLSNADDDEDQGVDLK